MELKSIIKTSGGAPCNNNSCAIDICAGSGNYNSTEIK
jgi:hypothetical protein